MSCVPATIFFQPAYGAQTSYIYYTSKQAVNVLLFSKICQTCNRTYNYDGVDDHIFNYSNRKLFSHELLDSYTAQYSLSETPIHAFIKSIKRRYIFNGSRIDFIGQELFTSVYISFIDLQKWEFKYCCPWCGPHPMDLICDGTRVTFPKRFLGKINNIYPWLLQYDSGCI
jgi:hypothetical protein